VRGLELEGHFKIPAYGWMMKRFGNIPVGRGGGPSHASVCAPTSRMVSV
jgi:1-acyl-sn-glycerol-3-phosphate acyltransferase